MWLWPNTTRSASGKARFQMVWVAGAFLPVVLPIPLSWGYVCIAGLTAAAAFLYATGRRMSTSRLVSTVAAGRAMASRRLAGRAARTGQSG